jgi:hypothetical protein
MESPAGNEVWFPLNFLVILNAYLLCVLDMMRVLYILLIHMYCVVYIIDGEKELRLIYFVFFVPHFWTAVRGTTIYTAGLLCHTHSPMHIQSTLLSGKESYSPLSLACRLARCEMLLPETTLTHTQRVTHWRRQRTMTTPPEPTGARISLALNFSPILFPSPSTYILEQPSSIYTRCLIRFSSLQFILVSQEKKQEIKKTGASLEHSTWFFVLFRFVCCCCWDRNTRKGLEMLQFMVWWFVSRIDEWTGHQWATLDYSSSL